MNSTVHMRQRVVIARVRGMEEMNVEPKKRVGCDCKIKNTGRKKTQNGKEVKELCGTTPTTKFSIMK